MSFVVVGHSGCEKVVPAQGNLDWGDAVSVG